MTPRWSFEARRDARIPPRAPVVLEERRDEHQQGGEGDEHQRKGERKTSNPVAHPYGAFRPSLATTGPRRRRSRARLSSASARSREDISIQPWGRSTSTGEKRAL